MDDWVPIGFPENRPYRFRMGCVPYGYEIARCQLTNAAWCKFLNAVPGAIDLKLFHPDMEKGILGGIERRRDGSFAPKVGWEKKPVVYVNYFSLLRYCNFLTSGDTERGSYDMKEPLPRRMEGGVYFLPSNDEWVKAAYFDPATRRYRRFPSGDALPSQDVANYQPGDHLAEGAPFYFADVDGYPHGASAFGVVQMGGNAWEFLEDVTSARNRLRGGSFGYTETGLDIANCDFSPLGAGNYVFGARIVKIEGGWRKEYLRWPLKFAILRNASKWKISRAALKIWRILRR